MNLDPRYFLADELAKRCKQNSRYSLRAFARSLNVTPSALSMYLSGKRTITARAAHLMARGLRLSPQETMQFVRSCLGLTDVASPDADDFERMSLEIYEVISEWHYYAILSMTEIKGFTPRLSSIASRLGLSMVQVKVAAERLERLGLLSRKGKTWKQTGKPIKVENALSTSATRRFQRQILEKAIVSLENDPMEVRDITSMTFAMDPALVPFALDEIRKFRRGLMKQLENRGNSTEVYNLAVQIYPVTRIQTKTKKEKHE